MATGACEAARRIAPASGSYLTHTGALHRAASRGDPAQVEALLSAGADPSAAFGPEDATPLHAAAARGSGACVHTLLQAGADPAAASRGGFTPLHSAAGAGRAAVAAALLAAAPHAALLRAGSSDWRPLDLALSEGRFEVARLLLCHAPLPPLAELLAALETESRRRASVGSGARVPPLYACLVARLALSSDDWRRVPFPCPGLAAALPAVLARSEAEAAQLVQHLPVADRARLRAAALCLHRSERVHGLQLPAELSGRILALGLAGGQAGASPSGGDQRGGVRRSLAGALKSALCFS